jgi:hypothetical protein
MSDMLTRRLPLLVLVIAAGGCGAFRYGAESPAPVPHVLQLADPIVTGAFIVEPRTFKPFKVSLAPGMMNPRLEGTFTASGARNDIEVTLLDEVQFANWQNRRRFEAAYVSGRVTSGTISVSLPQGPATYFVVFSNRFSLISNKAVIAEVQLVYQQEAAS